MAGVPDSHPFLDDLDARGLIHDSTQRAALAARLAEGPITLYCGFDPTADSLHVGNLLGLVVLRRFAEAGHHPLVLAGGATGMVGDPGGRSDERNLLDAETLAKNLRGITDQITRILGPSDRWELVDNASWTAPMTFLDFLRDIGKHITVNQMMARDSVKARLTSENGISFTEFSYQLIQANDYWWLHTNRGCDLQVGGSDQWGNIVAGVEMIRKRGGGTVHALTWPLLMRADGTKFGKSASGESVWLNPERTSPYAFFQFFMNVEDADVQRLLLQFTLLDVEEIAALVAEHAEARGRRIAQSRLATELTTLVHGPQAASQAQAASQIIFGGSSTEADESTLEMLVDEVPTWTVPAESIDRGLSAIDALVSAGLCSSKADARRTLAQGGGYCNDERLAEESIITRSTLMHDRFALLRRGRKAYALLVVGSA